MKTFKHTPLTHSLPELECITTSSGRHYITPVGLRYPSITHVLSVLNSEAIAEWRKRIGLDEATQIAAKAADRGTSLHACIEDYLKNQEITFPTDKKSHVKIMFHRMKSVLADIDNVVAQEVPLYSDTLKIAGRCDLIADYNNIPSVIDFKGSTKAKKREWILGYFIQATAYSLMFEERTGICNEQIVIMLSGEDDFSCQVFVDNRKHYIHQLNEVIERFKTQNPEVQTN
jgi:PD-(D/E)XK nuclease superfamily